MQQKVPCRSWAQLHYLMFLQLLWRVKKVLWDVSMGVLVDVLDRVQVLAPEDVSLHVQVHVKVPAQVVVTNVQDHARIVVLAHANILVVSRLDSLQGSKKIELCNFSENIF